jgi:hypothetical protein
MRESLTLILLYRRQRGLRQRLMMKAALLLILTFPFAFLLLPSYTWRDLESVMARAARRVSPEALLKPLTP